MKIMKRSDALVVFGVTGDLAHKMIFPALYAMARRGVLDVPVVGVPTITAMAEAGATCLCISAGKTLMFDRDQMIGMANKHKLAILAV